ncbi:MAG: WG repeat-containing protein [Bacteroidetes bacterium]|nr:WG repeat-containing protein [Bacteroidota bacterium]
MKKILTLLFLFPLLNSQAQKWEKNYDFVDNCVCGLSKVKKNDKVGYVSKEGVVIIQLQYDEGLTFKEGYAAVRLGSKWQYLDSTGKALTEAIYEDAGSFNDGLAFVSQNNLFGYINTKGEMAIPMNFSGARNFAEGLAPVANAKGYWGYVDEKGNWVIKPTYDFTDVFEKGEARVIKDGKVFYINKENKMVHE